MSRVSLQDSVYPKPQMEGIAEEHPRHRAFEAAASSGEGGIAGGMGCLHVLWVALLGCGGGEGAEVAARGVVDPVYLRCSPPWRRRRGPSTLPPPPPG
jgi:hypothetical protein